MPQVLDGRYELGDRIGRGGAARVHRAVDQRLGREVAVKILDDQAAVQADPAGRERFLRETQTAAQLHHPHVVTVFDAGESDGELFLVMELVDGITLSELIATRGLLSTDEAAAIAIQILSALQAAHDLDIVHRDVKPANVLIDSKGDAHLTDFGIARRLDDIEAHLTSAGKVIGTPTYLAPEQAVGGSLGVTTDVYLVGLVLDEMLTARRSRSDTSSHEAATRLAAAAVAFDPRDVVAGIDDVIAGVVVKATDPDPARRFASAAEMAVAVAARAPIDTALRRGSPSEAGGIVDARAGRSSDATVADATVAAASPRTATLVMPAPTTSVVTEAGVARAGAPSVGPARSAPTRPGRRRAVWGWRLVAAALALVVALAVLASASRGVDVPAEPVASVPASIAPATVASTPTTQAVQPAPTEPTDAGGGDGGGGGNGQGNGQGNGKGRGRDKD